MLLNPRSLWSLRSMLCIAGVSLLLSVACRSAVEADTQNSSLGDIDQSAESKSEKKANRETPPKSEAVKTENSKAASDSSNSSDTAKPPLSEKSRARSIPTDEKPTAEDRSSRASARAKGDLTFDDLKFDIEKDGAFERSMLPKEIEELNKRDIRIRGYILPASTFKLSGITEFVLVRDNMECCFGPGAAIYDCIIVHMAKGKTADFSTRPVTVRGKFEIKEFKYPESEQHYAIYYMTATEVK